MTDETIFQITCILLFLPLAGIGFYHRVKASNRGDLISQREEGWPIMIFLRLFGFSMWIGLLLYMIDPNWMAWAAIPLPSWLRWVGAGLILVTIPLIYWMFRSLGKNVTDTVSIREEHQLVTHGPYRWIRHPMYSFSFLFFVGFSLLTTNGFIFLTGMLALSMIILRTPIEEAKLIAEFGEEYRDYMKQTGRFFPRIFNSWITL